MLCYVLSSPALFLLIEIYIVTVLGEEFPKLLQEIVFIFCPEQLKKLKHCEKVPWMHEIFETKYNIPASWIFVVISCRLWILIVECQSGLKEKTYIF